MISIRNLHIAYKLDKPVIAGLDLDLHPGTVHGLAGMNGAGKTTLLEAVFGLVKVQKGEMLQNGSSLTKRSMAYLPSVNYFYANITGKEYLSVFKNEQFDLNKWNSLFGLPLDKLISTYSAGMRKKLAILGVLKMDKAFIMLDEPFNGLDIEGVALLKQLLPELGSLGKTILVTSHIIETLENSCSHFHLLEDGRISLSKKEVEFQMFKSYLVQRMEAKNRKLIIELMQ